MKSTDNPQQPPIERLGARALIERYACGTLSPVAVAEAVLERAADVDQRLNVFQCIDRAASLEAAKASERRWSQGAPLGALDGVPVSIKDLVAVRGFATRCGSRTTPPDVIATEDCPPAARLREAGAILFGKTHTSEFGWKGLTDSPLHGATANPWDPGRSPGGSSGGAGVAVAAGAGPLAHGSDAAGSVRIPASYCGIYGFKPTTGRVPYAPNDGPYAALSAHGVLARSVGDAARALTVLTRPDSRDWTALPHDGFDYETVLAGGIDGLRIAYSPVLGENRADPEIERIVEASARRFEELGAEVTTVGPVFDRLEPEFEAYWKAGFACLLRDVSTAQRALMDERLVELADQGRETTLEDYYDALAARARLGRRLAGFHRRYDLLLTPTTPTLPPPIDVVYHSVDFDRWRHAVPFTMPFNLTGQPAASIPAGLTDSGMPVGLQIVGPRYADARVLAASRAFERLQPMTALDRISSGR